MKMYLKKIFKDPENFVEVRFQEIFSLNLVIFIFSIVGLYILFLSIFTIGIEHYYKLKILGLIIGFIITGSIITALISYKIAKRLGQIPTDDSFLIEISRSKITFFKTVSIYFGTPYICMCLWIFYNKDYASFFEMLFFLMLAIFFSLFEWYQFKKIVQKFNTK